MRNRKEYKSIEEAAADAERYRRLFHKSMRIKRYYKERALPRLQLGWRIKRLEEEPNGQWCCAIATGAEGSTKWGSSVAWGPTPRLSVEACREKLIRLVSGRPY